MARDTRAAPADAPATTEPPAPFATPSDWTSSGVEALRTWMNAWMQAAQNTASMFEDLQRQGVQAATAWEEAFALGAREVEQAGDINHLLAAPAVMFNRGLEYAVHHAAHVAQHLTDAEMAWFEIVRRQSAVMTRFPPQAS